MRKHPRRRGEDPSTWASRCKTSETPPQARGRLSGAIDGLQDAGNTPAGAGKTPPWARARRRCGKYPRRRGEDHPTNTPMGTAQETPPQARGRLSTISKAHQFSRNTPAGAGKTIAPNQCALLCRKHPRRRGEDNQVRSRNQRRPETPPQARGRQAHLRLAVARLGNTPAGAGKTRGECQEGTG